MRPCLLLAGAPEAVSGEERLAVEVGSRLTAASGRRRCIFVVTRGAVVAALFALSAAVVPSRHVEAVLGRVTFIAAAVLRRAAERIARAGWRRARAALEVLDAHLVSVADLGRG